MVVKSYALSQSKSYEEALRYLQKADGLLVNAAKIQYQQMLNMYAESQGLFDALTTPEGSALF
jgi:hypothetical protein